jgi:hypothetical protein
MHIQGTKYFDIFLLFDIVRSIQCFHINPNRSVNMYGGQRFEFATVLTLAFLKALFVLGSDGAAGIDGSGSIQGSKSIVERSEDRHKASFQECVPLPSTLLKLLPTILFHDHLFTTGKVNRS